MAEHPSNSTDSNNDAARSAFTSAAIGMGWQLAVIVLIPIFGGYKLDEAAGSSPLWTLIGLVLALVGSILVIRKALKSVNNFAASSSADSDNEVKHDN